MTKHKWEEEWSGKELLKKKSKLKRKRQNRTERHIRIIMQTCFGFGVDICKIPSLGKVCFQM